MDTSEKTYKTPSKTEKKVRVKKPRPSAKLDKVTHLYLQENNLTKIPNVLSPQDVRTLYLYNNKITKMDGLSSFCNLEHLYLQNNQIEKINDLSHLRKLKKLYLGRNCIAVLEGLEGIDALEELHIEKQNLPDNAPLCLDPRTVISIGQNLKVLNISHNKITTLTFLAPLKQLIYFDASFNDLDDIKEVCQILRQWPYLTEAKLIGNPLSKAHRYREDIIANTFNLNVLDNKTISDISRTFIQRFEEGKMLSRSKQSVNINTLLPGISQSYPQMLQKEATNNLLKDIRCKNLDDMQGFVEAEPVYLSWNHLPKRPPPAKPPKQAPLRGHKMENHKNILVKKTTIKMKKF